MNGVRGYVALTDGKWYRYLQAHEVTEANFWQPSGGHRLRELEPGSPFLFKSKAGDGNRIIGGGFYLGWSRLHVSQAWDFFGAGNGRGSLAELHAAIADYRRGQGKPAEPDPEIGCIMLGDVRFFAPGTEPAAPPDWARNLVNGKYYTLGVGVGSYIQEVFATLLAGDLAWLDERDRPGAVAGPVLGGTATRPVRLRQGAFRALVQEAYGRRCAVTGDRILPVLQAAHIRPVSALGQHRVDNGLLLRSDVHTLFDAGYLGIHPQQRSLLVSPRLRVEFGNGEQFYARARSGEPIRLPERVADRPNEEFLTWHADSVFLAS